jgi:hypothetical protein
MAGTDGEYSLAKLRAKIDAGQPRDFTADVANNSYGTIASAYAGMSGVNIDRDQVPLDEILAAMNDAELQSLVDDGAKSTATPGDRKNLWLWDQILRSGAPDNLLSARQLKSHTATVWAGKTTTLSALSALTQREGTYSEVYWGDGVTVSHHQVKDAIDLEV